jgi:hypothetical protein
MIRRFISFFAVSYLLVQFSNTAFSQCTAGTTATFLTSGTFGTGSATSTYTGNPATACTIIIPSGITININGNTTWNGDVQIAGTLVLSQRLTIGGSANCDLEVLLDPGGKISDDPNAGGSNERLVICGKTILTTQPNPPSGAYNWPTPAGTGYTGPGSIGENFNGVLPIELAYFHATCIDQQVTLNWATSTEENFDYFDIERSVNGIEFQSIGSIKGIGGKNQLTEYSHIDYVESSGRYYYRLKSIDYDRSVDYSKIISVLVGSEQDIVVYPNPVVERKLSIRGLSGPVQCVLTDQLGRPLMRTDLPHGQNEMLIDESLSSGMYIIRIIGTGYSKTVKVQIL